MFNVFLLNLLPQSCGQRFLLWQILFIWQKKNISLQIPFFQGKLLKWKLTFLSKFVKFAYNMKRVLKIFFFHILAKCMPGWWVELWILQQHDNFFKNPWLNVVRNMIFGRWYLNHPEKTTRRRRAYCTCNLMSNFIIILIIC